jgi:hypothetical protein
LGNILGDCFSPTHLVTLLGKQTRWSGQHFFVKKLRSKDDWEKWAKETPQIVCFDDVTANAHLEPMLLE